MVADGILDGNNRKNTKKRTAAVAVKTREMNGLNRENMFQSAKKEEEERFKSEGILGGRKMKTFGVTFPSAPFTFEQISRIDLDGSEISVSVCLCASEIQEKVTEERKGAREKKGIEERRRRRVGWE